MSDLTDFQRIVHEPMAARLREREAEVERLRAALRRLDTHPALSSRVGPLSFSAKAIIAEALR